VGEIADEPFCRLAAIVFEPDEDPDAPLAAFVAAEAARGLSVAGLLQQRDNPGDCECHEISLRNLTTGERLTIMQDLGPGATSCRLDPAAIAVAAVALRSALARRPDLLVANRFAKLEAQGGGLIADIGDAVAQGAPLIVCVPARFLEAWNAFAAGLDAQLPPRREAIEAWWDSVEPRRASAA
jgi:molybdate transport system ATP-binding protein